MIKALLLSFIIHLIILILLGRFSFTVPEMPDFPQIRVSFGVREPQAQAASPGKQVEQSVPVESESAASEAVSSTAASSPVINTDRINDSEQPAALPVPSSPSPLPVPEPSAEVQTSAADVDDADDLSAAAEESMAVGGAGDDSAPSDENGLPDVRWEGGALYPRKIPEPEFTIPYGASLPEHINIHFSVQHDGTVVSIKVLPPGSGHIDLDRQIRAYVADFLFEEFDSSEEKRSGTLKLYLKAMGNAGI